MKVKVGTIYELQFVNQGLGEILLKEVPVKPYKYDPSFGNNPISWIKRFDTRNWSFFIAYDGDKPVAAMTVLYKTKGVNMLVGRDDLTIV